MVPQVWLLIPHSSISVKNEKNFGFRPVQIVYQKRNETTKKDLQLPGPWNSVIVELVVKDEKKGKTN